MCGGSSSSPTNTTTTTSNIPDYAQPYVMGSGTPGSSNYINGLLPQASALTNLATNPYQQYQGQMVAGFNPLQQQSMNTIQGMTPAGQINQGTGLAGLAGQQAQNVGNTSFTGDNVNQYMSPYTQDVVQQQQAQAIQGYANNLPTLGSTAQNTGNLGSSREALMQSQLGGQLQGQLQGITAQGYQGAFQNAQNQFNTQQQTQLNAANSQLNAANTLGTLGGQQYGQQSGIASAQMGAGSAAQNLEQEQLNTNYQNFINQQNYPYAQLGYLSDILHGTASTAAGSGVYANYQQTPNVLGQVAGLGTAATGLAGLFGSGG